MNLQGQSLSKIRHQSTNPTYVPDATEAKPPICINRNTHHIWVYSGATWYDVTGVSYIDLDPSPTNEKIVSLDVVSGVLRINENGVYYNVPINDIIADADITGIGDIVVSNVAGVVTISSNDPDNDATNECNNDLAVNGAMLELTDNCGTTDVAIADIAPVQSVVGSGFIGVANASGVYTISNIDPDQDATNELDTCFITQGTGIFVSANGVNDYTISFDPNAVDGSETILSAGANVSVSGNGTNATPYIIANTAPDQVVSLSGGGIVSVSGTYPNFTVSATEADGSTSNEIQTLSIAGNVLSLSNGGGSVNLPSSSTTNVLGSAANTMTSTVNGVAATAQIVNTNAISYNIANGSTTTTVNGVVSNTATLPRPSAAFPLQNGVNDTRTGSIGTSGSNIYAIWNHQHPIINIATIPTLPNVTLSGLGTFVSQVVATQRSTEETISYTVFYTWNTNGVGTWVTFSAPTLTGYTLTASAANSYDATGGSLVATRMMNGVTNYGAAATFYAQTAVTGRQIVTTFQFTYTLN